jgi:murein DD-endopeptidase MepM/ murein hydrolase activator NlpD
MLRRKLLTVIFAATLVVALAVLPIGSASAEQRTLLVTLLGGKTMTVTVDVAPGTPVDQIQIPGVNGVIVAVQDITAPAPAPEPPAPAAETMPAPETIPAAPATTQTTPGATTTTPGASTTTPAAPAGGDPANGPKAKGDGTPQQEQQETTGDEAQAEVEGPDGRKHKRDRAPRTRRDDGAPTTANPTFTLAEPGAAPLGVPNFFIEKFRIPPFLLPIYQAAGIEYGIRWEVLAAINEIETDYGRNLNVSSAGALGWMQFMPASWRSYGVDGNDDGRKDPYNPVDAIFAAARYLRAAGAEQDLRQAVFAYNHADWYVDSVLLRARLIGGLPADFVGSLTGLTQGRFPVHAKATYADDISERDAERRIARGHNAAVPVDAQEDRRSIDIFAKPGSPVIAVQDGRIVRMGTHPRLGRFVQLRDAYGNTYTYGNLKSLATEHPVPKPKSVTREQVAKELELPKRDPKPSAPASAGRQAAREADGERRAKTVHRSAPAAAADRGGKERLFANPARPHAFEAGGREQILDGGGSVSGLTTFKAYFSDVYGLDTDDVVLKRLHVGSKVIAGTILGRIGKVETGRAAHVTFEIRPAGRGAPRIDPKPILDGWKLLESTAIYRAEGRNALVDEGDDPSVGQVLLMSKEALTQRVLDNPRIEIYDCGRRDIQAGVMDRRVLASLEFLAASGLRPTVTSLRCGHSYLTASGNVSHHSSGNAVDVAKINGIPVLGHQGPGSITDVAVRRLLTLQGTMKPAQIITLMTYPGTDNTLALPDHADHIHVGFQPLTGPDARKFDSVLKPEQWSKLIDRLNTLENPEVSLEPSKYSLEVRSPKRASVAHESE